jgi:zinc transport system ATP-binding protein
MTAAPLALEVAHLAVRFGPTTVFDDLSFQVERGSTLAVLGPNGAGKTVLFKALIGALPSSGSVQWAADTHIGYVPQKLDLDRDVPITGLDFLQARASLARRPQTDIPSTLGLVGLPRTVARQPIGTLSGGQFQRLLIAFALMGHPTVLMLDEPTAGVDEPGQERLNALIERLRLERGLTVLFISHELSVIFRHATQVLCLAHRHACIGPPRTILTPDLLREMYGTAIDYHVHDA